jgi:riboflavin synthase
MFTGIVEEIGCVADAHDGFLRVHANATIAGTKPGDSIAINGVDLTVAAMTEASLSFHAMPETYRRSNLGELRPGDRVGRSAWTA